MWLVRFSSMPEWYKCLKFSLFFEDIRSIAKKTRYLHKICKNGNISRAACGSR